MRWDQWLRVGGLSLGLLQASWLLASINTNLVFASDADNNRVAVIDGETYEIVASLIVGVAPSKVAITPDRTKIYVANTNSNTISVVDVESLQVVATISVGEGPDFGIAFSPDSSRAYISHIWDDTVKVIDVETNQVLDTIAVGSYPGSIAITPDGSKIYVSNVMAETVSVINTSDLSTITTISVPVRTYDLVMTPDGSKLFTISYAGNTVIDTATDTVIDTFWSGSIARCCAFNQDGTIGYIVNGGDHTLVVLDVDTMTLSDPIEINADNPQAIAVSLDQTKLFIASYDQGHVLVLDASTYEELATVYLAGAVACVSTMMPIDIQPPLYASIRQDCNRFFNQRDWVNTITWKAPGSGSEPASYRLYRDEELNELLATLDADLPLIFRDHLPGAAVTRVYYLVAVDDFGTLSEPIRLEI